MSGYLRSLLSPAAAAAPVAAAGLRSRTAAAGTTTTDTLIFPEQSTVDPGTGSPAASRSVADAAPPAGDPAVAAEPSGPPRPGTVGEATAIDRALRWVGAPEGVVPATPPAVRPHRAVMVADTDSDRSTAQRAATPASPRHADPTVHAAADAGRGPHPGAVPVAPPSRTRRGDVDARAAMPATVTTAAPVVTNRPGPGADRPQPPARNPIATVMPSSSRRTPPPPQAAGPPVDVHIASLSLTVHAAPPAPAATPPQRPQPASAASPAVSQPRAGTDARPDDGLRFSAARHHLRWI